MRKKVFLFFLIVIIILTISPVISIATSLEEAILKITTNRYINGEEKQGYSYNTSGYDIGKGHKIIFQIMDKENSNKTNYFSLNATSGTTWNNENMDLSDTDVSYKSYYDLNSNTDIEELKMDNNIDYNKIAGNCFRQIWWILNNTYISMGNEEIYKSRKEQLLNSAGIVLSDIVKENSDEVLGKAYKYIPQNGIDYTLDIEGIDKTAIEDKEKAIKGWYYYNEENVFTRIDISDELIEIASQSAIWYYTNYLNLSIEERKEEFNIKKQGLKLLCSTEMEESVLDWKPLSEQGKINGVESDIYTGTWLQDQATILAWYLIDSAQNYADKFIEKNTNEPLVITKPTEKLEVKSKHIVNNNECYIIGPIEIDENINQIYKLDDEVKINNVICDEYNILSREKMQTSTDKKISDKIGQEIYLSVPITWIEKNAKKNKNGLTELLIQFEGIYNFNEKKLRKSENSIEQPIVEIILDEKNFNLNIEAVIDEKNPPQDLEGEFDLSLKKYIEAIYSKGELKEAKKEPKIDTSNLASGKEKSALYTQDKSPKKVKRGDYVIYNFTVYNEGDIDGIVNKITDNIPKGLQFVYIAEDGETIIACDSNGDSEILTVDSKTYKLISEYNTYWALDASETGLFKDIYNTETNISISCDVESFFGSKKIIKSYKGAEDTSFDGANLDKLSVKVVLRVNADDETGMIIRNEAAITDAENTNGIKQDSLDEQGNKILQDRDSEVNNWLGKDGEKNYQDDEDYDNILLGTIDLALKKFVIAISSDLTIEDGEYLTESKLIGSDENPYLRANKVDTTRLKEDTEIHDAEYEMDKTPILIPANSYVLYNIRIYNEGGTDLYAGEITDKLPENLDYVDCNFNREFRWKLESDGKTIKTDYLAYRKDNKDNLLKAFDKENDDGKGSKLNYKDIQILCKVNEKAPSGETLVNKAEITKYQDEDGKTIEKDEDSMSNNMEISNEDDNDYEEILVQTFDLSLSKSVSIIYITQDGQTRTIGNLENSKNGIPKIEIDRKKLQDTVVKIGYRIQITNEGDVLGYAKKIVDYIPDGLKFYEEDNSGWELNEENIVSTKLLENKLLKPNESTYVTLILRWENGKDNLNIKTNTAEIMSAENEYKISDRDSIPNNKNENEDDFDNASVLLALSTGLVINFKIILFVLLGIVVFILVLIFWIIIVKKYIV